MLPNVGEEYGGAPNQRNESHLGIPRGPRPTMCRDVFTKLTHIGFVTKTHKHQSKTLVHNLNVGQEYGGARGPRPTMCGDECHLGIPRRPRPTM